MITDKYIDKTISNSELERFIKIEPFNERQFATILANFYNKMPFDFYYYMPIVSKDINGANSAPTYNVTNNNGKEYESNFNVAMCRNEDFALSSYVLTVQQCYKRLNGDKEKTLKFAQNLIKYLQSAPIENIINPDTIEAAKNSIVQLFNGAYLNCNHRYEFKKPANTTSNVFGMVSPEEPTLFSFPIFSDNGSLILPNTKEDTPNMISNLTPYLEMRYTKHEFLELVENVRNAINQNKNKIQNLADRDIYIKKANALVDNIVKATCKRAEIEVNAKNRKLTPSEQAEYDNATKFVANNLTKFMPTDFTRMISPLTVENVLSPEEYKRFINPDEYPPTSVAVLVDEINFVRKEVLHTLEQEEQQKIEEEQVKKQQTVTTQSTNENNTKRMVTTC